MDRISCWLLRDVITWHKPGVTPESVHDRCSRDYEQVLLTYSIDYHEVRHDRMFSTINEFFGPAAYEGRTFSLQQEVDFVGLQGRLLSSSYTPAPEHPNHAPMLAALRRCFDSHQQAGRVVIEYTTRVYFGRVR